MTPKQITQPFSEELIELLHSTPGGAEIMLTTITDRSKGHEYEVYGVLTWGHKSEQRVFHSQRELMDYLRRAQK